MFLLPFYLIHLVIFLKGPLPKEGSPTYLTV